MLLKPPADTKEAPINHSYSIHDLLAIESPEAIIEGLFHKSDIMLVHSVEESYKSIFVMQMAEALATARPLLGDWAIPTPWRIGLVETEMHPALMKDRLALMFPDHKDAPSNITFMHTDLLKKWRRCMLENKFKIIEEWVRVQRIDILILDTVNDFFRGKDDPSSETVAGKFFDELRNLGLKGAVCVRHDRKTGEKDSQLHSNERIRGSAEFKEDPEVIIHLDRADKRTNEVRLDVGKLRYGRKPPIRSLWFDSGTMRLTGLPPVIALLVNGPQIRQFLIDAGKARFDLGQGKIDKMIKDLKGYLISDMDSHKKCFEINKLTAVDASWFPLLTNLTAEETPGIDRNL